MDREEKRELLKLIKGPILTDKTTQLLENNQYCFRVHCKANKTKIKEAIEYIFNVSVAKINTCHMPKKRRKVGRFQGYKSHYKKVIIKLLSQDRINLFAEQ